MSQVVAGNVRHQPQVWRWSYTEYHPWVYKWKAVVYDPSGEILLKPQQRSADWVREVKSSAAAAGLAFSKWLESPGANVDYPSRYVWVEDYGKGFYMVTERQGVFFP